MHSPPSPRTLLLTERVPHVARLAPADVAFLLEHHRGHVEVLPGGRRDCYRLTALGCIGVLHTPACRFVIRPKIPLVNVFAMLDPLADVPSENDCITPRTGTVMLDFLAGHLARRLNERIASGLHRTYRERREQGTTLLGRLDLPAQLRQAPGRKDQLHSRYEELTADLPCNQALRATAEGLAASPLVGVEARAALRHALTGLANVSGVPLSPRLWEAATAERLPAEYPPLLDLCRLLADGLTLDGSVGPLAAPSFLLNLERVFERHVTRGIVAAFSDSGKYTVSVQPTHIVNEAVAGLPDLTMRPDLTIDRDGRTSLVVDAKWKRLPGHAETADLYQVLAYGTALGAEGVVLVYPGKRWSERAYRFTHSPLHLTLCTLRVGGSREACLRCVRRLARCLRIVV